MSPAPPPYPFAAGLGPSPALTAWTTEPFVIGDGAMGTMLQAAGLPLEEAPERWNRERPDVVTAVHAQYAAAGARWLGTNTFGANRGRLAHLGWEERVPEVNREAVRCAREAAGGVPLLGSIGPTGLLSSAEWERAYEEQVTALAGCGVAQFLVETICRLYEGAAAVRCAREAGASFVIASFTPGPKGDLLDNTRPEAAAEILFRAGASVVGVNCGAGPESLLLPARRLVDAGLGPVLAAPNAGLPTITAGRAGYGLRPDAFARAAIQFREAGVRFFAGCCGTTPAHIRAAVDEVPVKPE